MNKKLGIIIPHRHRENHLRIFRKKMQEYLSDKDIPYILIVIDQDDSKPFNRGMLLNIGFEHAKKHRCDYVVFHDVDMLPMDVDYSYSDIPLHLATDFVTTRYEKIETPIFDQYFGGVTMFPIETFEKINGYSNRYWGWGFEDDDLLYRCKMCGVELDTLRIKNTNNTGKKLKFNGKDAYVVGKNFNNLFDLNSELTIFSSFYPDEIYLNHEKERDDFTVFSVEGYNSELTYNSFQRHSFQTFDRNNESISMWSKIEPYHQTNITLTFDPHKKEIRMFKDGEFLLEKTYTDKLYNYFTQPKFYLGCSVNLKGDLDNFFKGYIDSFAIYSKILSDEEIKEISNLKNHLLTSNTENYKSANKLKLYYNSNYIKNYKLFDLSCNENDGIIKNCEILEPKIAEYKEIYVPYRRKSTFIKLQHNENGFVDNKWKNQETRWNQLRFINDISRNPDIISTDGLSDLQYTLHSRKFNRNDITLLKVGIG
jgi:hypothetical protein